MSFCSEPETMLLSPLETFLPSSNSFLGIKDTPNFNSSSCINGHLSRAAMAAIPCALAFRKHSDCSKSSLDTRPLAASSFRYRLYFPCSPSLNSSFQGSSPVLTNACLWTLRSIGQADLGSRLQIVSNGEAGILRYSM